MKRRPTPLRADRRGGLLLETLIAIAIFVGIATFALGAVRDSVVAAERARLRIVAVDLASSRIAEIEAGLVSPMTRRMNRDSKPKSSRNRRLRSGSRWKRSHRASSGWFEWWSRSLRSMSPLHHSLLTNVSSLNSSRWFQTDWATPDLRRLRKPRKERLKQDDVSTAYPSPEATPFRLHVA